MFNTFLKVVIFKLYFNLFLSYGISVRSGLRNQNPTISAVGKFIGLLSHIFLSNVHTNKNTLVTMDAKQLQSIGKTPL